MLTFLKYTGKLLNIFIKVLLGLKIIGGAWDPVGRGPTGLRLLAGAWDPMKSVHASLQGLAKVSPLVCIKFPMALGQLAQHFFKA